MSLRSSMAGTLLVLVLGPFAAAADQPEPRVPVAKNAGMSGTLLRRSTPTGPWMPIKAEQDIYSDDTILGGLAAAVDTLNGDVRLAIKGDLADHSPFPILETGVILHPAKDVDLDFTLDRGRVTITNQKKSGSAKVRIHCRGKAGEFTLKEPGASFALETYGRWPTGVPFKKDAKPEDGPPLALVLVVLKGEVAIRGPKREFTLKAPPGIGMFMTDNMEDTSVQPQFIDKLPAWAAGGPPSEEMKKLLAVAVKYRSAILEKPLDEVLDAMVQSDDPVERRLAVVLMGATDDLTRLGDSLMKAQHPDVWDAAVVTLRHWIGRAPGQDMKLYNGLIEKRGFKPVQAEAVLSLLHSFSEAELNVAETYEVLLNYMESDKLGLRGLAYWHLLRLVPQGKKFGFEPTATKEKREAALEQWRKLIPTGKLPPKPNLNDL